MYINCVCKFTINLLKRERWTTEKVSPTILDFDDPVMWFIVQKGDRWKGRGIVRNGKGHIKWLCIQSLL